MALIGSFDAPGGNVEFARPFVRDVKGAELLSAEQRAKCIELKRSPSGPGINGWVGSDALYMQSCMATHTQSANSSISGENLSSTMQTANAVPGHWLIWNFSSIATS